MTKAEWQTRLGNIQTAITATLERNAASYSTEIQSLASLDLKTLRRMEREADNEIRRLERGTRFGKIGFTNPS